jgi:hypothetical protein
MSGACLLEYGWGQECQSFPNICLELQLDLRRCSRSLQLIPLLVPGLVRSHRRREWSSLHDMQSYKLRDAYYFILFHDKVAIQRKYNLLFTHTIYFSTGQLFIGY